MPRVNLPSPNDMLQINGEQLTPKSATKCDEYVAVPTHSEAQRIIVNTRKRIADLPMKPDRCNTVAMVLTYKLFGLEHNDIAIATNGMLSETQVDHIVMSDAYRTLYNSVIDNIVNTKTEEVTSIINVASRKAATRMASFVDSRDANIAMAASKDILDRAGHAPAHLLANKNNGMGSALTINIINVDETSIPTIQIGE